MADCSRKNSSNLNIYLARHGQDEDNAAGILNGHRNQPLTELGKEQARTVANKIHDHQIYFDAVYASPLQRASETASIIVGSLAVIEMDDLKERDFGVLTGTRITEIKERCQPQDLLSTDTVTYFLSPQGAETFPDLLARAKRVLDTVIQLHANPSKSTKNILLVTHGDLGKMLYAAYYNLDWKDVLKQFHFGNSDLLLLSQYSRPEQAHVLQSIQFNA